MSFDRNAMPAIADVLTDRGLTLTGARSSPWRTTRCEFHDGSDSMRVNTVTGGWCCMACGVHGGDALAYPLRWREVHTERAAYAEQAGKAYRTLYDKVRAWSVMAVLHVQNDLRDSWRNLSEIHAAPEMTFLPSSLEI